MIDPASLRRESHLTALTLYKVTAYSTMSATMPLPGTTPMTRMLLATSVAVLTIVAVGPAAALSSKECSTKYQAAKQTGTLSGQKWNDFRKAQCSDTASPGAAATTVPNPPAPAPVPTKAASPAPAAIKPAPAPAPTAAAKPVPAPAPMAAGSTAFPRAVDPKYASEAAGKARMHTCLDGYNAAKAAGTLGDLKWIQKGGGYYSQCNARLKS